MQTCAYLLAFTRGVDWLSGIMLSVQMSRSMCKRQNAQACHANVQIIV